MAEPFYIESETGAQIESGGTFDPNKFYVESGTGTQYQGSQLQTPVILSSSAGEDIVKDNTNTLQNLESTYTVQPGDTLNSIAGQYGYENYKDAGISGYSSGDPNLIYPGETLTLKSPSNNPAMTSMTTDINNFASSNSLTPEEQQGYDNLLNYQNALTSATASAREASNSGDYQSMDYFLKQAEDYKKQLTDNLSQYYESVRPLRERQQALLSPSAREQELSKQLIDVRNQIDQFNLQTEEDKFKEFEGQTLGFAGGRAAEIDRKAEFKRMRMALNEKNLLLQLGLAQEARKMEGLSLDQQLSYLAEDFELQQEVQERLMQKEDDLVARAERLEDRAKSSLSDILGLLEGVNPQEIPPESQEQIATLAARSGLPIDLVMQALEVQYQRSILEEATTAGEGQFTLSEGATRYDAEGNIVAYNPKTASSVGSEGVKIASEDERTLIGAGFTPNEIDQIISDVNQYGIDSVLEGIDGTQQVNAVKKVFGINTVSMQDIENVVETEIKTGNFDPVAILENNFTTEELKDLAREAGFTGFLPGVSDNDLKKYLDSPEGQEEAKKLYIEILAEQYRNAGMLSE